MRDRIEAIPADATVYLQPCGLCEPAIPPGTPLRALPGTGVTYNAIRLIAARYGKRIATIDLPVGEAEAALAALPGPHGARAAGILQNLMRHAPGMKLPGGRVHSWTRPCLMGIVNVTPDSFSDGGDHADTDAATAHGRALADAGAHVIDVGGESTRPGARPVWQGDELARVIPVIEALAGDGHLVSIDTRNAEVMRAGVAAGAAIVNDVSALGHDGDAMATVADLDVPVILVHSAGDPTTMQDNPAYEDVLLDVYDYLEERIAACVATGIARDRIVVDPGIGFGKTVRHNLALINGLALFHGLGCPVLLGASRKRFIGAIAGVEEAKDRLAGSIVAALAGLDRGAHIVRVHDVAAHAQALAIWQGLHDEGQMPPA